MRKLCRLLLLAALPALAPPGVLAVEAQPNAAPAATSCPPLAHMPDQARLQEMIRSARDRGVLWKLEKNGRTSWLYGTIHVGELDWTVPGPTVMNALKESDALALELNVMDPKTVHALRKAMQADPHAQPLDPLLQERLSKLKAQECTAAAFDAMRPDAQVAVLATLIARREGLDPDYGVDASLGGAAKVLGKPIIALETVQTQIKELVSSDPQQVESRVKAALDQLEDKNAAPTLALLARVWADGRLNLLENYPQWCECLNSAADRRAYQQLVVGRNAGMADAIAQQIAAGKNLFAAVGALHMTGTNGLPQLLEKQGFKGRIQK